MAWFIRVNGYIPSSSELITFISIAKNIGIQSIAYGLARTGFNGTMSPCSFIPLTSIVLVSKFYFGSTNMSRNSRETIRISHISIISVFFKYKRDPCI